MLSFFKRNKSHSPEIYVPDDYRERKGRKSRLFLIFTTAIFFSVLFFGAWFLLRTPFFRIKNIEVIGIDNVTREAVISLLRSKVIGGSFYRSFLGVNHFLNWSNSLNGKDLLSLPAVKSIEIEKNYSERGVTIKVEERQQYGIWCLRPRINADDTQINADGISVNQRSNQRTSAVATDDECWWFDDEGIIFKRAVSAKGSLIIAVNDYSERDFGLRSEILPERLRVNAFSVFEILKKGIVAIREVKLNDLKLEEFEVLTHDGPKIYFSLRFPASNSIVALEDLISKSGFKNLEYLDFRVENRVYYK